MSSLRVLRMHRWMGVPAVALSTTVLLLSAAALLLEINERDFRERMQNEVTLEARILASTVSAALVFNDRKAASEYVDALGANPEVRIAAVYDSHSQLFCAFVRNGAASPAPVMSAEMPRFEGQRLGVRVPVTVDRSRVGDVYVEVDVESISQRMQQYGIAFVVLAMAALTFGVLAINQMGLRRANRDLASANENLTTQIVRRERAEDALRQSQKMEAVGQLTGGVAHDFNNILQIIVGNLEAIDRWLEDTASNEKIELRRWVQAALRGASRAAVLTQRLLAFARRQALAPRPIDLNRLVTSMTEMLRRTLGERIEVRTALAPDLWPVLADANQLENAVLNLALNARDAMAEGGVLTIETSNVYLDDGQGLEKQLDPGSYVVVAVADSGIGMSPATAHRAFEPFFTTKPSGQGTGLGLSLVYGFARQSMGCATIDSVLGLGSTVRIYLPRLREDIAIAGTAGEKPASPREGAGEVILLVEDDDDVRVCTAELLRAIDYDVLEARDGASALRILDSRADVSLLFTDVGLPGGMNGRQLAEVARANLPQLRVLFATGYAGEAFMKEGGLAPGTDLLSKPVTHAVLAAKIREILEAAAPTR